MGLAGNVYVVLSLCVDIIVLVNGVGLGLEFYFLFSIGILGGRWRGELRCLLCNRGRCFLGSL